MVMSIYGPAVKNSAQSFGKLSEFGILPASVAG